MLIANVALRFIWGGLSRMKPHEKSCKVIMRELLGKIGVDSIEGRQKTSMEGTALNS